LVLIFNINNVQYVEKYIIESGTIKPVNSQAHPTVLLNPNSPLIFKRINAIIKIEIKSKEMNFIKKTKYFM